METTCSGEKLGTSTDRASKRWVTKSNVLGAVGVNEDFLNSEKKDRFYNSKERIFCNSDDATYLEGVCCGLGGRLFAMEPGVDKLPPPAPVELLVTPAIVDTMPGMARLLAELTRFIPWANNPVKLERCTSKLLGVVAVVAAVPLLLATFPFEALPQPSVTGFAPAPSQSASTATSISASVTINSGVCTRGVCCVKAVEQSTGPQTVAF